MRALIKAGNKTYSIESKFPDSVPVFPITGALLLPGGSLPLNIFEPRYLEMTADALASHHLIGLVQPNMSGEKAACGNPVLSNVGCLGRIVSYQETGDGRLAINLAGVCRINLSNEVPSNRLYRTFDFDLCCKDLEAKDDGSDVDRDSLLKVFSDYLDANGKSVDWDIIDSTDNATLVTLLCMISPFGPAEKQALLEAEDHKTRAATLVAITELSLANDGSGSSASVQ